MHCLQFANINRRLFVPGLLHKDLASADADVRLNLCREHMALRAALRKFFWMPVVNTEPTSAAWLNELTASVEAKRQQ